VPTKSALKEASVEVFSRPSKVSLGQITNDLINSVIDDKWLHDEQSNRRSGFGLGNDGRVLAYKAFKLVVTERITATGIYRRGEPVGFMVWVPRSFDGRRVSIHMHIAPEAQGYGVGPAAMHQWLGVAFADGVYRVEAEVLHINRPAVRALEHYGFHREARLTSAWWMDNNFYDLILLRMLRKDWKR